MSFTSLDIRNVLKAADVWSSGPRRDPKAARRAAKQTLRVIRDDNLGMPKATQNNRRAAQGLVDRLVMGDRSRRGGRYWTPKGQAANVFGSLYGEATGRGTGYSGVLKDIGNTKIKGTAVSGTPTSTTKAQRRMINRNTPPFAGSTARRPGDARARVKRNARAEELAIKKMTKGRPPGAGRGLAGFAAAPIAYGIAGAIKTRSLGGVKKGLDIWKESIMPSDPSKRVY